jgi:hypothetical protein
LVLDMMFDQRVQACGVWWLLLVLVQGWWLGCIDQGVQVGEGLAAAAAVAGGGIHGDGDAVAVGATAGGYDVRPARAGGLLH